MFSSCLIESIVRPLKNKGNKKIVTGQNTELQAGQLISVQKLLKKVIHKKVTKFLDRSVFF